jgi:GNAT superfamily N-acetyltransferase
VKFRFEALGKEQARSGFCCGESVLDRYFREQVGQDIRRRVTHCFVALDEKVVAGFYTLASASIPIKELPECITKRLPRYAVLPAVRIGRLALDQRYQGQGLGSMLLIDAMRRALRAEAANFTLIVDAKDGKAAAFYEHHGFVALESSPLTLFLPLATAAKALGSLPDMDERGREE